MGAYDSSELHARQRSANLDGMRGTVLGMGGGAEVASGANIGATHRWRYLLYLLGLLAVGLLLTYTSWLPGLGVFLIAAVIVGVVPVTLHAWMGK